MGKRQNENAQLSKEEYEASGDGGSDEVIQRGFEKASEDVMKRRKIVRVSQQAKTGFSSSGKSSIFGNVSLTTGGNKSGSSSNPFANISFGKTNNSSTTTNAFTSAASAPVHPVFASPQMPTVQKQTAPVSTKVSLSSDVQQKQDQLAKKFNQHVNSLQKTTLDPMAIERYITTYLSILGEQQQDQQSPSKKSSSAPAEQNESSIEQNSTDVPSSETKTTQPSTVSATKVATPNLFAPPTSAFTQPLNVAGASNQPVQTTTGGPFSGFKFGGSAAANVTFGQAPSTSTAPAFGGFSTTPAPAVTAAVAAAQSADKSKDDGNDDDDHDNDPEKNKTEKAVANADENVEVVYEASCRVYNYRREDGNAAVHGTGKLKLQRNKNTGKSNAVVREPTTGTVKFNVSVSSNTPITLVTTDPTKDKPKGQGGFNIMALEKNEPERFYLRFGGKAAGEKAFEAFKDFAQKAS